MKQTARKAYREDAGKTWEQDTAYIKVDMTQVFMLLQLAMKEAIFTPMLTRILH